MPYRRYSEAAGGVASKNKQPDGTNNNESKTNKPQKRLSMPMKSQRKLVSPRIPKSLQNVFLASARGEDVKEAPVKDKFFRKKLGKRSKRRLPVGTSNSTATIAKDQPTPHQVSLSKTNLSLYSYRINTTRRKIFLL